LLQLELFCISSSFQIIPESIVATIVGIIVLIVGIGLQVICIRIFKQAKTTPLFQKPVSNILQTGPYAKSRNPIYIAVFLQFLGLAFLINTWWLILVLSILYVYLRFGVIAREESYLLQRFQDEYRTYQSKVPRWL
jgi:protein-S-isoprenylcysteine O-methyltransferase Ste14